MKIIHCSDLHLDSRMESNLPVQKARERGAEICTTFSRMVEFAQKNGVKAVLIAGDMFDSERISSKTADYVFGVIEQARGIVFFYLRGNHDESRRAFAGRHLPKNLKTFSDRWTYYKYDDVIIAGAEFSDKNYAGIASSLQLPSDSSNIVMLHGQISYQTGEDMVCLPELRNKNIDYLALGHIHSYSEDKLDNRGRYCYCGCLEGRGFDECGEKGFVLLETGEDRIRSRFIPFASRSIWNIPVDITGLDDISQIIRRMKEETGDRESKSLVKFTLTGSRSMDSIIDTDFLEKTMEPYFYFVKVKDESRLKVERENYEFDISLKGEFIRTVMASDLPDADKDKIIIAGIRALSNEEVEL